MALLKLFLVPSQNKLLAGRDTRQAGLLPAFVQGDKMTVELMLLSPVISGLPTEMWEVLSTASYAIQIGLYTSGGTQLAYQNTFTADGIQNIYSGVLNLSTAAIDTALSAATVGVPITAYLEVKLTDGNGNTVTGLQATPVYLYKTLITGAALVIPPADVGATQSWSLATFVRNDEPAGSVRIRRSASGAAFLDYIDDNGVQHFDPIT